MPDLVTLPKAHLHVHLESTVRWSTLQEIGDANGVPVPAHLARADVRFSGFRDFADANSQVRACLVRPEDFRRIAYEFCADEAAQGVRWAEVTFTAASHGERLGDVEMPLVAVLEGLRSGCAEHPITVRVVLDHSRRRSVARARAKVELARRFEAGTHPADVGVVAVGVAGDEAHPLEPFAEVFRAAHDAGLHVVHHAGETGGAAAVRAALDAGSERIGHGIGVLEDPDLVAEVRDRGVALEVCPSSNVTLGLVPSLAGHPLREMIAAGLAVSLNTDVPNVTGAGLATEYARVGAALGLGAAELAALAGAGIRASFAPPAVRDHLLRQVGDWSAGLATFGRAEDTGEQSC